VYIGRDLFGGAFIHDAWELHRAGVLTNPNMVYLGQIGRGKSSFVKVAGVAPVGSGRQAWVVDAKGEYGPLAEVTGATSLRIAPGGSTTQTAAPAAEGPGTSPRIATPCGDRPSCCARWPPGPLGRPLLPPERTAAELARAAVATGTSEPTLPAVVDDHGGGKMTGVEVVVAQRAAVGGRQTRTPRGPPAAWPSRARTRRTNHPGDRHAAPLVGLRLPVDEPVSGHLGHGPDCRRSCQSPHSTGHKPTPSPGAGVRLGVSRRRVARVPRVLAEVPIQLAHPGPRAARSAGEGPRLSPPAK
jgi:hypothetical protein